MYDFRTDLDRRSAQFRLFTNLRFVVSEKLDGLQEIGRDAVWLVSTAKSGFGVDQLYEQDPMTYWQYVTAIFMFWAFYYVHFGN